jgi:hypothetical protein
MDITPTVSKTAVQYLSHILFSSSRASILALKTARSDFACSTAALSGYRDLLSLSILRADVMVLFSSMIWARVKRGQKSSKMRKVRILQLRE